GVGGSFTGPATFFESIIVNRIHGWKRLPSNFGAWHTHAEGFLHAYHQFECVHRVAAEAIRAKERKVICDLVWSSLQHQIFDQHLLNTTAQISLGHKRSARSCR